MRLWHPSLTLSTLVKMYNMEVDLSFCADYRDKFRGTKEKRKEKGERRKEKRGKRKEKGERRKEKEEREKRKRLRKTIGYYLVTEGLYAKHPFRVRDFPPDEGSIIGSGMGFAQVLSLFSLFFFSSFISFFFLFFF